MRGRPKKLQALKVISGTVRKDREGFPPVPLPVLTEIPDPPDWLPNSHAVKEWHRLAPILVANGLLTEGGQTVLAHLCGLCGKLVQLWAAGETPTANLIGQYRGLCNDFGLTPVSQSKVRAGDGKAEENRFAGNGQHDYIRPA